MKFKMTKREVKISCYHQILLICYIKNCNVPYINLNTKLKAVWSPVTRLFVWTVTRYYI